MEKPELPPHQQPMLDFLVNDWIDGEVELDKVARRYIKDPMKRLTWKTCARLHLPTAMKMLADLLPPNPPDTL